MTIIHRHPLTDSNYVGLAIMGGLALVIAIACFIDIWHRRRK
jgi:hypothetical protein